MAKEEPKIITFDKCPVCGSEKRYCESLGNQEKARGHMRKDLGYCFQLVNAICIDDQLEKKLPIGTSFPAYTAMTDICSDCGNVYVTKIVEQTAMKQPNLLVPGQQGDISHIRLNKGFPGLGISNPQGN